MADEQTDEAAGRQHLIELKQASEAARIKTQQGGYSAERWQPWREAAAAFSEAVTAHAKTHGLNRFDLEKAVTTAALHGEPAES